MNTPHKTPLPLVFLALATLTLAGCTSSEAGQTTPSEATADSSTSASTAASADSSAGEQKYSGGSKAPAGEYRAADEHGPAQNVPKPKEPEGMNIESTEGIEKFLNYWMSLRNYSIETGDTSTIAKYVAADFKEEGDNYDTWESLYQDGGWIVGGFGEIHPDLNMIISHGDGYYSVPVNYEFSDAVFIHGDEMTTYDYTDTGKHGYELKIQFADDGKWYILNQVSVGQ